MAVTSTARERYAAFLQAVDDHQTAYYKVCGRYWQGLPTKGDATKETVRPDPSYADVGITPPSLLVTWVDSYGGPDGDGYVVRARYTDTGGQTWEIATNRGPETWRESRTWQAVTDEDA